MSKHSPLHEQHLQAGAKLVDFAGWSLPISYTSQIEEHHAVRRDAGLFDVSHMTITDVQGAGAQDFLRYLLANDVAKLTQAGKALYSCMLNQQGGIIDDLITYYIVPTHYRLITNGATRAQVLAWLAQHANDFAVQCHTHEDSALIALQGPNARALFANAVPANIAAACAELKAFFSVQVDDYFIARTGYTGEDGLEIALPAAKAPALWQQLIAQGATPCGLGARDTLRLEAGLNLYGADMDESTSPLAANLAWTVALEPNERQFIGRSALSTPADWQLVGVILQERGVLRGGQAVKLNDDLPLGKITSGTYSPTLEQAIGFARIPVGEHTNCQIERRGQWLAAQIVKPVFVRNGKALIPTT